MDREYLINDYVNYNNEVKSGMEDAEYNLENLQFRIKGSKSVNELKRELITFLDNNNISGQVREDLERIASEFNENTDLYDAERYLENYLQDVLSKQEQEFEKSNGDVRDIQKDVVSKAKEDLDEVGITVTGDEEELYDSIDDLKAVEKIKSNVDNAKDYFSDRANNPNLEEIEISVDTMQDALDSPGDNTILKEAINNHEEDIDNRESNRDMDVLASTSVVVGDSSDVSSDISDSEVDVEEAKEEVVEEPEVINNDLDVIDRNDGSVEVKGDSVNRESLNFMAMMTAILVSSAVGNDLSMNLNLDMRVKKEITDKESYKIIFGNFPINGKNGENKLPPELINRIKEAAQGYNPNRNYMETLSKTSPEIAETLKMLHEHLLDNTGAFQLLIKNGGTNHEMMFAFDENYNNVSDAFQTNGAILTNDASENSIVRLNNTVPGEQLLLLRSTNKTLEQKIDEKTGTLSNEMQYIKKMDDIDNVGNASTIFLTVVTVAEVLMLGIYLFLNFTK